MTVIVFFSEIEIMGPKGSSPLVLIISQSQVSLNIKAATWSAEFAQLFLMFSSAASHMIYYAHMFTFFIAAFNAVSKHLT